MTKQEVRAWIEETGVIAAVRERLALAARRAGRSSWAPPLAVVPGAADPPQPATSSVTPASAIPALGTRIVAPSFRSPVVAPEGMGAVLRAHRAGG